MNLQNLETEILDAKRNDPIRLKEIRAALILEIDKYVYLITRFLEDFGDRTEEKQVNDFYEKYSLEQFKLSRLKRIIDAS